jgi:hypothetical protein
MSCRNYFSTGFAQPLHFNISISQHGMGFHNSTATGTHPKNPLLRCKVSSIQVLFIFLAEQLTFSRFRLQK